MKLRAFLKESSIRWWAVWWTRKDAAAALAAYDRGETSAAPLCAAIRAMDAAYLRHCAMDDIQVDGEEMRG